MKHLFANLLLLIVLNSGFVNAQSKGTVNKAVLPQVITAQANQMGRLFIAGYYREYLKYIHPVIVEVTGGSSKMINLLNTQNQEIKRKGVTVNSIIFESPSEIVTSKNELQCTISQHTELKSARGRVITYTTLIAISTDNGKNWKFIDTSNKDIVTIRKLLPNLSSKITLPPKQKPAFYNS